MRSATSLGPGRRQHHPARLEVRGSAGGGEAGAPDLGGAGLEHASLVLEVRALRLAVLLADEAVHGDGDVGGFGGVTGLSPRVAVGAAVPRPVLGAAAEDAKEHGQPELDGAQHRVGAAAGAEPELQWLLGPGRTSVSSSTSRTAWAGP